MDWKLWQWPKYSTFTGTNSDIISAYGYYNYPNGWGQVVRVLLALEVE